LKVLFSMIFIMVTLNGCKPAPSTPAPPLPTSTLLPSEQGLSEDQIATLSSLEQLDDFPLYTMRYIGAYPSQISAAIESLRPIESENPIAYNACRPSWGCSLFATLGDPDNRLYGRNFDWRFSPAVLLFTDPPGGYASVSMVDIEYLGFEGSRASKLTNLPLDERQALLDAPAWPFDGMNDQGLAIGMAAVHQEDAPCPDKRPPTS
jgi:hypothetical protein